MANDKLKEKKEISELIILCCIAYFVSYISRINLSASLVEVINSGFASKIIASGALGICSVTYGAGQIISGYLGDRFKPEKVMFSGFIITSAVNIFVYFLKKSIYLPILWGINGIAQSMMWPPMVAILSDYLRFSDYSRACVKITWASCIATIAVYLAAPVAIKIFNFKILFLIGGGTAFVFGFIWNHITGKKYPCRRRDEKIVKEDTNRQDNKIKFTVSAVVMLAVIMLTTVFQGFIRDSVSNWMPVYFNAVYNTDTSLSVLMGVCLPLLSMISVKAVSFVFEKGMRNEFVLGSVIFAVALGACLCLSLFVKNIIFTLVIFSVISASAHGINIIQTCMIAPHYQKYGKVSLVAGMINACTYLGSALSSYGIALFTDVFGWGRVGYLLGLISLAGGAILILFSVGWKKFRQL